MTVRGGVDANIQLPADELEDLVNRFGFLNTEGLVACRIPMPARVQARSIDREIEDTNLLRGKPW